MKTLREGDLFEGLSVVHLKVFGLWKGMQELRASGRVGWPFRAYMALSVLYICPYISFQLLCAFFVSLDLKMATFIYLNGTSTAQVWFKIVMFWRRFGDQVALFDLLRVDFLPSLPPRKLPEVRAIYSRIAVRLNLYCVLAFAGSSLTIVTWLMLPGFATEASGTGRKKVASGWYPVPYSDSPWYEVVFAYETLMLTWHGSLIALYECVLLMPLVGLYAHFLVLGYHISTLRMSSGFRGKEYLNTELRKIMDDYDKLLRFADKFRRTNNPVITCMLALDIGMLLSTLLYILFGHNDALSTFKLMLFFSFATIEITLLCISSSFVETASSEIGYCIYSSDWYRADKKFTVAAQLMMIRSRRPVTLTAIKMYPVNLGTLISVFQFIYSTVALFSKMKE